MWCCPYSIWLFKELPVPALPATTIDTEDTVDTVATQSEPQPEALEEASKSEQKPNEELEVKLEAETEQKIEAETEQKEEKEESEQEAEARTQGNPVESVEVEEIVPETEQPEETALVEEEPEESDEYEYVDPGELVLGEHTQAEIGEALDNLASLGLEGATPVILKLFIVCCCNTW